jgi:hypothetical protein
MECQLQKVLGFQDGTFDGCLRRVDLGFADGVAAVDD